MDQTSTPPVAFFEVWEFALYLVGRPALHQAHQIAERQLWRDRREHVDMIRRQHASDDLDTVLRTNLSENIAHPQLDIASQHLVAILGRPNEVVAVIIDAMLTRGILHDRILQKMNRPKGRVHFLEDTIIRRCFIPNLSRLKDGGVDQ